MFRLLPWFQIRRHERGRDTFGLVGRLRGPQPCRQLGLPLDLPRGDLVVLEREVLPDIAHGGVSAAVLDAHRSPIVVYGHVYVGRVDGWRGAVELINLSLGELVRDVPG